MSRWRTLAALMAGLALALSSGAGAAEHPGTSVKKEHPGKEMGAVTADGVKAAVRSHVEAETNKAGVFALTDPESGMAWKLKLEKIHDPVRRFEKEGKTFYFTCSDFRSLDGDDVLDVDFWMVPEGDALKVVDTKIHKLNGKPRYMYEGIEIRELK